MSTRPFVTDRRDKPTGPPISRFEASFLRRAAKTTLDDVEATGKNEKSTFKSLVTIVGFYD